MVQLGCADVGWNALTLIVTGIYFGRLITLFPCVPLEPRYTQWRNCRGRCSDECGGTGMR